MSTRCTPAQTRDNTSPSSSFEVGELGPPELNLDHFKDDADLTAASAASSSSAALGGSARIHSDSGNGRDGRSSDTARQHTHSQFERDDLEDAVYDDDRPASTAATATVATAASVNSRGASFTTISLPRIPAPPPAAQ